MRPVIIFRSLRDKEEQQEKIAAEKAGFIVLSNFGKIQKEDLVFARYCCYPFYSWVEEGVVELGGQLINSIHQNAYVTDLENYVADLKELTPKIYTQNDFLYAPIGSYIVKGQTNSRKFLWNNKMFAERKSDAWLIAEELRKDGLLENQKIFYRPYVKLKEFIPSRYNHPPITEEYRFFVLNQKLVCGDYYWSSVLDELTDQNLSPSNVPLSFLEEAIRRIGCKINFYSLDVARTERGEWIVIELNEGQMSGLSCTDPFIFYSRLIEIMKENGKI